MIVELISVHPHGRGDYTSEDTLQRDPVGSPPRAWGLQAEGVSRGVPDRFTPTGVGTTAYSSIFASAASVHPHGRGDYRAPARDPWIIAGSPPRAWGLPSYITRFSPMPRFTPTGVGTTMGWVSNSSSCSVHPHGRGDYVEPHVGSPFRPGSPPRAWGLRRSSSVFLPRVRFTPTGVGTTTISTVRSMSVSVHPHGRGDYSSTTTPCPR